MADRLPLLISEAEAILIRLLSLAKDQIELAWGFKQDLEKLCHKLEIIQVLLVDAKNRKISSEAMMVLLKNLKAATFDTENVLDELAYEDLRRKIEVQNHMRNKVRDLFTLSDPLSFRFKMASKINNINKLLDIIYEAGKKDVGLKPAEQLIGPIVEPWVFRQTSPFIIDGKQVVGREGDISVVVEMLLRSDIEGDLPVTAIVGMPGLGKTTLAQLIYKEANVLTNFGEERIWICVSDNFDVVRLLNEMVQSLTGNKSETRNIEGVVRQLRQKLNGKKYLLVLDDVWNENPYLWETLRHSLIGIGGSKESKVVVTTRSMEVVLAMRTWPSCTHKLTTLSEDDCLTMFRKRAFAIGGPRETETLLEIGRRLVAKCKGVPLSINSLAGLLYSKQDEREWESIETSEIWRSMENEDGILGALRLSFDNLPSPSSKQSKQLIDANVEPREFRLTHPFIDDTQVVGREGDISVVVAMLLGSGVEGDLPVTAIVGMPGLGKTTLAQLVYKEVHILTNFEERIWICVSDDFNVVRLLNEMVQSLTGYKSETRHIEGLVSQLRQKLNGKKYLLVLDDVWNENPDLWENLKDSLIGIGGSKESKVLVTTRSMEVVFAIRTWPPSCTHKLTTLSEAHCWTIFKNRVFVNGGPRETKTLLEIGRRLVAKCKGVPLSIRSLAGLLYSKFSEAEWESIETSEIWRSMENEDGILRVLRLSFDNLPSPSLKQSFAYCSIFPKDKVIVKDELIQLWMALGYLQSSSRSKGTMEELGDEYFMILWRNSLFQEVEFDEYNNITTCKMHDLVHDLALHVSQGNCLTLEACEMKNISDVQHLSLFLREETGLDISEEIVGKLRTLFLTGHLPETEKDFKRIRALRLVESCADELPSSICKSIHLRFLDISESSILKIPNCITKLYNLETLKLPWSPKELPIDFHKLVSLRHLYLKNTYENRKLMPMKIGQLTSLQTLPFFVVGKESGHRIEELGSLSKLSGRLQVYELQHVKDKEEAEKAKMLKKSNIQELQLHWDRDLGQSDNNHEDVLEGLKPHQNVKGFEVINFGGRRLPSWMSTDAHSLQRLVKIKLRDCRLCEQVPMLGHLPHLEYLEMEALHSLKRIGHEFYGAAVTGVFPALINFKLDDMPELEEWLNVLSSSTASVSTIEFFPRLQKLEIYDCPKLITLPAFKGSTSLQQLSIVDCPELMCLPEGLLQPTLVDIWLYKCTKLKTPNPEALHSLTCLKDLRIRSCPNWGSCWEEGLFCPASLQRLDIGGFGEEYRYFPWPSRSAASPPWSHFTSLEYLTLRGWPEVKFLPDQLELLPALISLVIRNFSALESMPECLGNLSSLQSMNIIGCPLLEKRCEKGIGEDWHKIAHIPEIWIDWRKIE